MTRFHIALLHDTLRAKRQSFCTLPIVDLAALLDGSGPKKAARDIRWALANVGFMYVKIHGVAQESVDAAFGIRCWSGDTEHTAGLPAPMP